MAGQATSEIRVSQREKNNKPLIRSHFWWGNVSGGRLTSHEIKFKVHDSSLIGKRLVDQKTCYH